MLNYRPSLGVCAEGPYPIIVRVTNPGLRLLKFALPPTGYDKSSQLFQLSRLQDLRVTNETVRNKRSMVASPQPDELDARSGYVIRDEVSSLRSLPRPRSHL